MRTTFTFILLALITTVQGQLTDAYYLTRTGERITGKIYSSDLESLNRPNASLKWYEGETFRVVEVTNIDEVGIGTDTKFKKFTVQIDDVDLYNVRVADIRPAPVQQTVFLNVLVDGAAALYQYQSSRGHKYFYSKESKLPPTQLTYRKFRRKADGEVEENTTFRNQLQSDVSCPNDPWDKFRKVGYEKDALIKIFTEYNACTTGSAAVGATYKNESKSKLLNRFSAFANGKHIVISVEGSNNGDAPIAFGAGLEFETITPGRKFGFFLRSEAEKIKIENAVSDFRTFGYDGMFLSFLTGARYHLNRAADNHFYFDAGLGLSFPFSDVIRNNIEIGGDMSFYASVGAGYQITNKFGVQLRYNFPNNIASEQRVGADFGFSSFNVGITYLLFENKTQ